jgi:hypothetical protein
MRDEHDLTVPGIKQHKLSSHAPKAHIKITQKTVCVTVMEEVDHEDSIQGKPHSRTSGKDKKPARPPNHALLLEIADWPGPFATSTSKTSIQP